PVGGYARVFSGLSIRDFTKTMDVVSCSRDGLRNLEKTVSVLAFLEGLEEHSKSVSVRLKDEKQ
ncbi:histidinol dehydrogenase, partial [Candidatus Bathyarchaeota archaeon]|nr:histidinol dehydrogenase [Candidatus Bathyarchaeota archaeon]